MQEVHDGNVYLRSHSSVEIFLESFYYLHRDLQRPKTLQPFLQPLYV